MPAARQSGADDPLASSISPTESSAPPPAPTPATVGPSTSTSSGGGGGGRRGKEGKEKETFGCPFPGCGQLYSRMEYLKRHQRKHQDDRPFQCKDCAKAFARSDVLLRHRRRCHPTPPPNDRNSHSPPAPHRNYPGVPVSSSRTDAREASPTQRGGARKHPRQQSSGDDDRDNTRARRDSHIDPALEDYDREDDDGRYDENGAFGRQNGMGNGGVYSSDQFYGSTLPDGATYTPHLLPLFQQQSQTQSQQYHNLNDPDHLEDASVLLSMAYPGGVPARDNPDPARALPDWANNPTINMMMEAAVAANLEKEEASRNPINAAVPSTIEAAVSAADSSAPAPLPEVDPALVSAANEPESGFLNTMNWLSTGSGGVLDKQQGEIASPSQIISELANGWFLSANSPRPLTPIANSPFNFASLFASATPSFGNTQPRDASGDGGNGSDQPGSPSIQAILDQLAKYEVPITLGNPNPERPILRVDNETLFIKAGKEYRDKNSPFYLPAERFAGCYQIPHWALPSLGTLSVMACRTFHNVLNHFSFIHEPTFKLIDTAACLAFAICTIGGIKPGHTSIQDVICGITGDTSVNQSLDGPVLPHRNWETLYAVNWKAPTDEADQEKAEEIKKVPQWNNAQVVRSDKSNMLVKSFALAKGVLMTEYNVALVQALILYHAPNFLSGNEKERVTSNMFLGTIVNISRQVGFFDKTAEHTNTNVQLPNKPFTPNDLDRCWRNWIQMETRRRTAYLVLLLDTISSLESDVPFILTPSELSTTPLPAPDSVWKASTALEWFKAVQKTRIMTLDEAMRRIFFLPTFGSFDNLHEKADTKYYNLLNQTDFGPFARLVMIVVLLRGIIDIGEGKRDRGDWRDLTDCWISCPWLKPNRKMLAQDGTDLGQITRESLSGRFGLGLQKWREGWDFDKSCPSPASIVSNCSGTFGRNSTSPQGGQSAACASADGSSSDSPKNNDEPSKTGLNYCEDALPFYWLAQALLNIVNSAPTSQEPGSNKFSGLSYCAMLKTARTFTRTGEGLGSSVYPNCSGPWGTVNSGGGASSFSATGSGSGSGTTSTSLEEIMSLPPSIPDMGIPGMDMGIGIGGAIAGPGFGVNVVGMDMGMGITDFNFGNNQLAPSGQRQGQGQEGKIDFASVGAGAVGGGIWGQGPLAEHLGFIL